MAKLRHILFGLMLAGLFFASHGCYPVTGERAYCKLSRLDPALPVDRSKRVPMMRIGSLPHPFGPIPVNYANPNRLGNHSYRESAFRSVRLGETSAGIIYTQQVGFIDLAHTRNAADLTWYAYRRIRPALLESRPRVLLAGAEPSLFILHLDYPSGWHALDEQERDALADRVAVVLAVRMGYVISTWHEVLTTFGFHGVFGIPEHQSAFMYDDQPSHRVGAVAAGLAIERVQRDGASYNVAMTEALGETIDALGPLQTAGSRRAVVAARKHWWDIDGLTLRFVHLGMLGEPFEPMLIHERFPEVLEAELGVGVEPVAVADGLWEVPSLAGLAEQVPEWAEWLPRERVEIDPMVLYSEEILAAAGLEAPWIDLDRDGPALKAYLIDRLADEPVDAPSVDVD